MKARLAQVSVALLALTLLATGCSGNAPKPSQGDPSSASSPATQSSASSTSTTKLGEIYALTSSQAVTRDKLLGAKTGSAGKLGRQGWVVSLTGVHRIADDRVVVVGWVNGDKAHTNASVLTESGYVGIGQDGEFSDFTLKAPGDAKSYLPVRSTDRLCACSRYGKVVPQGDVPAYVVMSAPKDANTVSLTMPEVGTFANLPVSPPKAGDTVSPLPGGGLVRIEQAKRSSAGSITVQFALEHPTAGGGEPAGRPIAYYNGYSRWGNALVERAYDGVMLTTSGTGLTGMPPTVEKRCTCTEISSFPDAGKAVRGEIQIADPGGATVDVYPTTGQPIIGVPVAGSPSPASANVVDILSRSKAAAVTVSKGKKTRVDLDTSVLFALDSATLSGKANAVLDSAAKDLKAQAGRKLSIVGHTDSQGSQEHNLTLSRQRAEAVHKGLATRLGPGWSYTVSGVGEKQPLAPEEGDANAKAAAQAINRRVEVQVQ